MSELASLNDIEDTVEGMTNIIRAASYAFKALKDNYLSKCEKIYIPSTGKCIQRLRSNEDLEMYERFCKVLPMCYLLTLSWAKYHAHAQE